MNPILLLITILALAVTGCNGGGSTADCVSDNCVCPATEGCEHTCAAGNAECHIQGASGQPVDVQCDDNAECHVECIGSSSCAVDCGGSADCNVTCPPTGCTVTGCVGAACTVSCGLTGAATRSGSTATCP